MTTLLNCGDDIMSVKGLTLYVRQNIKRIVEKEGFISYTVEVNDISTNGGNYLGALQTVSIKGKSKDEHNKELNLFLKNAIPVDTVTIVDVSEVYLREGFIYNKILKQIEIIQDKYEIPEEERFNTIKSYSENNSQVIILEDVSKKGFESYERLDVISLKFAHLAIEQLGKFHAMAFVIKNKYPEYFEKNIKPLHSLFNTSVLIAHLRRCCDKAMETLEGDAKTKIDNFCWVMKNKISRYINVPVDEAVGLVHGDFRPNNMLFKETDGEISKIITVDYQVTQYGYPILDFIYFIFISTDQKFRKEHLEDIKNLYYTTLENFLTKFDIKAKEVYPRKQFEAEYKNMLDYGLLCFLNCMPFIFAKSGDVPTLEGAFQDSSFNLVDCYKDRLHGVVDDFIQWGYL